MKPFKIGHCEYGEIYATQVDGPATDIIVEHVVLRPIDAERLAAWLLKAAKFARKELKRKSGDDA